MQEQILQTNCHKYGGVPQTFQPPSQANLEVLKKKPQKNLEIRTSNLETSKICIKIKTKVKAKLSQRQCTDVSLEWGWHM